MIHPCELGLPLLQSLVLGLCGLKSKLAALGKFSDFYGCLIVLCTSYNDCDVSFEYIEYVMKVFVPICEAYSHTIELIYCKTDKYVAASQILSQFSTHCRRPPSHLSNSFVNRKTISQMRLVLVKAEFLS